MGNGQFGLFEAYGIELEYMLVDRATLAIRPDSDIALKDESGKTVSDVEDGPITWSNELAAHVIELKTTSPAASLAGLGKEFHRSARKIDERLAREGVCLLPTAMHPFMNPGREAKLWAHDSSEIYDLYDKLFGCKGHGWTNLQSMHINLPFSSDDEFGRLHAAIRFLLPVLPAFAASSPVEEGVLQLEADRRLIHYEKNQKTIPSITGHVIPEAAWTEAEYQTKILDPIYRDVSQHDPNGLLRHDWLNSRGAIARFERKTIEIRVLDIQESASSDLSLAKLVCETTRALALERICPLALLKDFSEVRLKAIYDRAATTGWTSPIDDLDYCAAWGLRTKGASFRDLFHHILTIPDVIQRATEPFTTDDFDRLETIAAKGNLSERIRSALGLEAPCAISQTDLLALYQKLRECLTSDTPFR